MKFAQSCLTLCEPIDYIVHGILQARILEWVAFPFSRGSSQPRDGTQAPPLQVDSLPAEPLGRSLLFVYFISSSVCLLDPSSYFIPTPPAAPVYNPTNSVGGFPLLHILANTCYLCFLIMAILTGMRCVSLWFRFAFAWWLVMLSTFSSASGTANCCWKHH